MVSRNGRSAEAQKVLADLDAEAAAAAKRIGKAPPPWSAAEKAVLSMIADAIDRKVDLAAAYRKADEPKVQIKLSTEMRLLEQSIARLLKQIVTQPPAPETQRTRRARNAANTRWGRDATVA